MRRLACFDLDNTLIDRDGAFRAWAEVFCAELGAEALEWLLAMDLSGYRPRRELFAAARERFGLAAGVEELIAAYDVEHPTFTWCEPEVFEGLARLRADGWTVVVVTNGGTVQQSRKLAHTGIGEVVDYSCISQTEGVGKPDPRIFEIAAERSGTALAGGWMVGDRLELDIAGGQAAGLSTILVGGDRGGRNAGEVRADVVVGNVVQAFEVIAASGTRS